MAVRDPDAPTRHAIDAVLAILLFVSIGAYWQSRVAPTPEPASQRASLNPDPAWENAPLHKVVG